VPLPFVNFSLPGSLFFAGSKVKRNREKNKTGSVILAVSHKFLRRCALAVETNLPANVRSLTLRQAQRDKIGITGISYFSGIRYQPSKIRYS